MARLTAQDKEWQRQDDARVLAQAEEIKQNSSRLKGAQSEANKMAIEQQKKASALKKVAKKPPTKTPVKKVVRKKRVVRKK